MRTTMEQITVHARFHTGHRQIGYPGKCRFVHGHTWKGTIVVSTEAFPRDEIDMSLDFGDLKNILRKFDHKMIVRGSLERLSPVLMTALVTAFALAPLLFEAERPGTEILHPVAVVIFSGLISSTLLDTFLTPAMFWLFGRRDVERPERARHDRIARGAIAMDEHTRGVLEQCLRVPNVGTKRRRRLIVDQTVSVAMRRDLVAGCRNPLHQVRVTLGNPPEHEKRTGDTVLGEDREQPVSIGLDAAFKCRPGLAGNDTIEHADVEVVLHVDRHRVRQSGAD